MKRWNISGGRVSSLLKSRVLCKKILTSGEQRIRLNLKTCFNSSSVILSFFLFLNRFTFALFHFYTLKWLNWEVWKNCQNMYFRIIIIVSFLKMQCAFWQRGWPLRLFEISFEATSPNYKRCMCPRLIWICFPDSRKYKFFEGWRLIFWPLNFWPLTSSSEWFLRITAKKWVNVYKFN